MPPDPLDWADFIVYIQTPIISPPIPKYLPMPPHNYSPSGHVCRFQGTEVRCKFVWESMPPEPIDWADFIVYIQILPYQADHAKSWLTLLHA